LYASLVRLRFAPAWKKIGIGEAGVSMYLNMSLEYV
jgi:hypothetical protein